MAGNANASFTPSNSGTEGDYTFNPYAPAGTDQISYSNPADQPNYYTTGAGAAPDNLKLNDPNLYSRPDYTGMSKSTAQALAFSPAELAAMNTSYVHQGKPTSNIGGKMVPMTLPSAPGGAAAAKVAPLPTNFSWANSSRNYTPPKSGAGQSVSITPQLATSAEAGGGAMAPAPTGSLPPGTSASSALSPTTTNNTPSASESFAAGGAVGATPNGNVGARPKGDLNAAYQTAQAALNYGRKKLGLLPGGNRGAAQQQPGMADGGVIPSPSDMPAGQAPAQPSPSAPPAPGAGGAPGGAPQGQQMGYVMGNGAVPPDQLDALTKQIDPQGTMDPSERTLRTIATGQNPDQSFGIIQGLRQKFNRYQAFAKTAAQGIQGKPADMGAAAHAANQAYENVPDGTSVQFAPAKGGIAVRVNRIAGGTSDANQPQDQGQDQDQSFADGGPVGTLGPNSQSNDNSEGAWTGSSVQQPAKGVLPVASDKFDPRAFLKGQKSYADGGVVDNDSDSDATTPPVNGSNPPLPTPAPMAQDAGPPTSDEESTAPSGVIPSSPQPSGQVSPQPSGQVSPQPSGQVSPQDFMSAASNAGGSSVPASADGALGAAAQSILRFLTPQQFQQHMNSPAATFDNYSDVGADKVLATQGTPGDQSLAQFIDAFNKKEGTNYSVGSASTGPGAKLPPGQAGSGAPAPTSQAPAASQQPATPNLVAQGDGLPVYDRSKAGNPINRGDMGDPNSTQPTTQQIQRRAAMLFPKASQQDQRNDYIAKSMAATQAQAGEVEKAKSTRLYGDQALGTSRQNVAQTAAQAKVQSSQNYADAKKYEAQMKASVAKDPASAAKWNVINGAITSAQKADRPMTDDEVQKLMGRIGLNAAPSAAPAAPGSQGGGPEIRYDQNGNAFIKGPDGRPQPYS